MQPDKKGQDRRNTDQPRQLAMFGGGLVALPNRRKPKPRKQRVT